MEVHRSNPKYKSIDGALIFKPSKMLGYARGIRAEDYVVPSEVEIIGSWSLTANGWIKRLYFPASVKEIQEYSLGSMGALEEIIFLGPPPKVTGDAQFPPVRGKYLRRYAKAWEAEISGGKWQGLTMEEVSAVMLPSTMRGKGRASVARTPEKKKAAPAVKFTTRDGNGGVIITGHEGELPEDLVIPSEINGSPVVEIGANAFKSRKIRSLVIEEGVRALHDWCFFDCHDLTSVTLPNSVISIGLCAFNDCWNMKTFTFPEGVRTLGTLVLDESVTELHFEGPPPVVNYGDLWPWSKSGVRGTYTEKYAAQWEEVIVNGVWTFVTMSKTTTPPEKPRKVSAAKPKRLAPAAPKPKLEEPEEPEEVVDVAPSMIEQALAVSDEQIPVIKESLSDEALMDYFYEQIADRYRLLNGELIEVVDIRTFYGATQSSDQGAVLVETLKRVLEEKREAVAHTLKESGAVHGKCKIRRRIDERDGRTYYRVDLVDLDTRKRVGNYTILGIKQKLEVGETLEGYFVEAKRSQAFGKVSIKPWGMLSEEAVERLLSKSSATTMTEIKAFEEVIATLELYPEEAETYLKEVTFDDFYRAYEAGKSFIIGKTGGTVTCSDCEGEGLSPRQINDELKRNYDENARGHTSFASFVQTFRKAVTKKLVADGVVCETCEGKKKIPSFTLRKLRKK